MKIVIDIPEEQFTTLNAKTQAEVKTVIDYALLANAIKNGTPVSTEGDLISREAMKEAIDLLFEHGGYDSGLVMNTIDNVPSVIPRDK